MNIVSTYEVSPGRKVFTVDCAGYTNDQIQAALDHIKTEFNAPVAYTTHTFNQDEAIYDLNQYVKDSVRTESTLENLVTNPVKMTNLLTMFCHLTEILDAYKKAIYYGKTDKLKKEYADRLTHIKNISEKLLNPESPISKTANANGDKVVKNLDPRVFHGILGILTEAGELADIALETMKDPTARVDKIHIQEELGDNMWYHAILHDALKLNPKHTLTKNTNKLKIRYPEKYSDESAEKRDLTAERKVLES